MPNKRLWITGIRKRFAGRFLLIGLVLATLTGAVLAMGDSSAPTTLHSGAVLQGGGYTLRNTVAQPGVGISQSASHTLCSGFTCGSLEHVAATPNPSDHQQYLPLIER